MAQKAEHTVHILEGRATLYKRPTTPYWFVRYKIGSKWIRNTTKEEDLNKARLIAEDIVNDARYREKNKLPIVSKKFKHVANIAIKRMQDLLAIKQGKVTYKHYIQVINKYLIPFFGNYNVDKIDMQVISKFMFWRVEKMNGMPSHSAINTHNSALNRVFDVAIELGYMLATQVPKLENKGYTSENRDDFTVEEYKLLYQYMRKWVREAREGNEKRVRNMLRDYVLVLANTGIRAGTEAMNLKWQHITIVNEKGVDCLTLHVKGKTKKKRSIQVPHRVARYLQRIQDRDDELKGMSFFELIDAAVDKHVFRINGKDMTSNFGRIFKRLLADAKLLVDRRSGKERTLYCLRHYYATLMITKGQVSTQHLADYMGTSEKMIQEHYKHLNLQRLAPKFVGLGNLESAVTKNKKASNLN